MAKIIPIERDFGKPKTWGEPLKDALKKAMDEIKQDIKTRPMEKVEELCGENIVNAWIRDEGTKPAPHDVLFLELKSGQLVRIEAQKGQLHARNLSISKGKWEELEKYVG